MTAGETTPEVTGAADSACPVDPACARVGRARETVMTPILPPNAPWWGVHPTLGAVWPLGCQTSL